MASVTRVRVTADLQYADVWISVMGSPGQQRATLAGLKHAGGYLQALLARQLAARQCPVLRFRLDESIKRGFETLRLIDQAMAELGETRQPGSQQERPEARTDGEDG